MKRWLAFVLVLSMLTPILALADAPLRLLGIEESVVYRGDDPNVRYEQVDFNIWGDPLEWIAEKGADVVHLNGRGVEIRRSSSRWPGAPVRWGSGSIAWSREGAMRTGCRCSSTMR